MLGVRSLSSLDKRLQCLEQTYRAQDTQHIQILPDYQFKILAENGDVLRYYKPSKTGLAYHQSKDFVRLIMGPYGSGKSTACISDIVFKACEMPNCTDNVRRCKVVVIRNTSGELETSTLQTWEAWFGDLGSVYRRKKPVLTYEHTFNDGNGKIILKLVFLALDRPDDLKKLKSTEYTLAYLNEANELPDGLLDVIKGRVNGRYPSTSMCSEKYFTGVIMDTNPPSTSHYFYNTFEVKKPNSYIIFKQPSGLLIAEDGSYVRNPDADNAENLREDYYTKMAEGADEEFIKVYCMGQYGLVRTGKPVYPQYNDDLHAVEKIDLVKDEPIYLGLDFGLTPACLVGQIIKGQLRCIKEFVSTFNTNMQALAQNEIKPWLEQNCKGMVIYAYHDPSDPESQSTGGSPSDVLEELGIFSEPSPTNKLLPRLDSVKFYLDKMIDGKPAFALSKSGCPVLREGFYGKYNYRLVNVYGELQPKEIPDKCHPHSDIHDGLQYICVPLRGEYEDYTIDPRVFLRDERTGCINA